MKRALTTLTEEEIARRLEAGQQAYGREVSYPDSLYPPELLARPPRQAAVLIPLLPAEDGWRVLFTRRNASLAEHSGQVAFPGGRADPGDNGPVSTALREAQEEIGLLPEHVRVLGRLNEFTTHTGYRVTPVVGAIPWPYPLRPESMEVSRIFTIPLSWLADPQNYEEQQRTLPPPYGSVPVIYYRPYDGEVLWGASARFTLTLLKYLQLAA